MDPGSFLAGGHSPFSLAGPFLIQPPGNRQAELPLMECTQCAHRLACASPCIASPPSGPLAFSSRNIGTYLLSTDMTSDPGRPDPQSIPSTAETQEDWLLIAALACIWKGPKAQLSSVSAAWTPHRSWNPSERFMQPLGRACLRMSMALGGKKKKRV